MSRSEVCGRCGAALGDGGYQLWLPGPVLGDRVFLAWLCAMCETASAGLKLTFSGWDAWLDAVCDAPGGDGDTSDDGDAPASGFTLATMDHAAARRWFSLSAWERRALVDASDYKALNRAAWRRLNVRERQAYKRGGALLDGA